MPYLRITRSKYSCELGLLREVLRPVVGGLERVAVEVAADVDSCARVAVVPPRAARPAALLDDRERDPRLREADAREQARLRRTRSRRRARRPSPSAGISSPQRDRAGVGPVEMEILEEHLGDVVGDRLAGEELHHLVEHLGRRWCREHAAGVAVRAIAGSGPTADLGLHRLGHVALVLVEHRALRAELAADPRRVAGHVHQRAQQRRDAHVLERAARWRRRRR